MRIKHLLMMLLAFTFMSLPISLAGAEELPHWAKQWKDWAQSTGNPDHIEWAEKYCSPESIKLGKEWEAYLGYNAVDMVAEDKTAPSIKPGLVITPENVKQYEKELEIEPYDDFVCDRSLDSNRFRQATGYSSPSWPQLVEMMHAEWINRHSS